MKNIDLTEINELIVGTDGEIFYTHNGYTSKLWKKLQVHGWNMKRLGKTVDVYNNSGTRVIQSDSKVNALKSIAELFY